MEREGARKGWTDTFEISLASGRQGAGRGVVGQHSWGPGSLPWPDGLKRLTRVSPQGQLGRGQQGRAVG